MAFISSPRPLGQREKALYRRYTAMRRRRMQRQEPVLGFPDRPRSTSMPDPAAPQPPQHPSGPNRKAGFMQVVGAVFWSFFGIRRKAAGSATW